LKGNRFFGVTCGLDRQGGKISQASNQHDAGTALLLRVEHWLVGCLVIVLDEVLIAHGLA
jgi:hypothetical protein